MWPIGESSCNWNLGCIEKLFIGVLMKEKEEKEKKKDNQYHLKKAMGLAIAIGLKTSFLLKKFAQTITYPFSYIFAEKNTLSLRFFGQNAYPEMAHPRYIQIANIVTAPPPYRMSGIVSIQGILNSLDCAQHHSIMCKNH